MSKRSIILLALLILSPVVIYFLWPTDEGRIKKLFREGAAAVEQKKLDDVMSKISFNYSDGKGLSYITIKESMKRIFSEMKDIKVECDVRAIEIRDDKATAGVDLRVIATRGNDTGYFIGDAAKPVSMKFFLEKERMKWLIVSSEGGPALE
jgi:hypothetical protein